MRRDSEESFQQIFFFHLIVLLLIKLFIFNQYSRIIPETSHLSENKYCIPPFFVRFTHLIAIFTSIKFCFVPWGLSSLLDVSSARRPEVVTHLWLSQVNNKVVLQNCCADKGAEQRVQ